MDNSILTTTKKMLGIEPDYMEFDMEIITHINSCFTTLGQLGVGPEMGFMIEDDSVTWDDLLLGDLRFNAVKTYVYLRVRLIFDPPTTSFTIAAFEKQIQEHEWRLNVAYENIKRAAEGGA